MHKLNLLRHIKRTYGFQGLQTWAINEHANETSHYALWEMKLKFSIETPSPFPHCFSLRLWQGRPHNQEMIIGHKTSPTLITSVGPRETVELGFEECLYVKGQRCRIDNTMLDTKQNAVLRMRWVNIMWMILYPSDNGLMPCCCIIWHSDPHSCIFLQFPLCTS